MVTLSEDDVGKNVVNRNGEQIGRVTNVQGGTAFVDPDPNITDTIKAKLGWEDVEGDEYRLDTTEIDQVSDDEIRLR